jgi:hypothetical protein
VAQHATVRSQEKGCSLVAQTHNSCAKIVIDFTEVTKKIHLKAGKNTAKKDVYY